MKEDKNGHRMPPTIILIVATAVTTTGLLLVTTLVRALGRYRPVTQRMLVWTTLAAYGVLLWLQPAGWTVTNIAVILAAAAGAHLLSSQLRSPSAVVVFLVTASVVDFVSFSGGLTHRIVESYRSGGNQLLLYLTLSVPMAGRIVPIVGFGDLLVGGAAISALVQAGLPPRPVWIAIIAGLVGALIIGISIGGAPAVPMMAAACLILVATRKSKGLHEVRRT